jgi:hypothetical protein
MTFTLDSNFQRFNYNHFREILPFLIERKFCYNSPNRRNGSFQSRYNYLNHPIKHQIKKVYGGTFIEPDTSLKNLINKLTQYFVNKLQPLTAKSALVDEKKLSNNNFIELKKEKNENIDILNEELNSINNNNYKNKRDYQNKYFSFNYYNFCINLIINSILFITVIFCVHYLSITDSGIIPKKLGLYLNIFIVTIFAFYLLLNLNNAELRNKRNWDQIYFKSMGNTADKV